MFYVLHQNNTYGFKKSVKDKIDRQNEYIYYRSYISELTDLNKNKIDKLLKHKEVIDKAVDFVLCQLRKGFQIKAGYLPCSDLNPKYHYNVIKYAEHLYQQETHTKQGRENCTQPYWVYGKHIKTYGFRYDKTLKSKFQGFIEFESAYKGEEDTIKLNLRLSKKAYKMKDTIFLDGFDIVYNENNNIQIRHVSEEVIERKTDNNIERHLVIDSFANIHGVFIDKNYIEKDFKHHYRIDLRNKIICGDYQQYKASKLVQKYIDKFQKYQEPDLFKKRMHDIHQNIKNRVSNIIGSEQESKIHLLIPTNTTSQVYNSFIKMFTNIVKDECKHQGIKLITHELPCETIISQVIEYKKKANEYQKKKRYGYEFKDINKVKASDIINCSILCEYPDYYIILRKNGKFISSISESTSKNDYSVSDKIKLRRKRIKSYNLEYPTFDEYKNEPFLWEFNEEEKHRLWIKQIKDIAAEACERSLYSDEEYNQKLLEEAELEKKQQEERRIQDLKTLRYPEKIKTTFYWYKKGYFNLCKLTNPSIQDEIDARTLFVDHIKTQANNYLHEFIDMNKERFEFMNIDYREKYNLNHKAYSYESDTYVDYDEPVFI